MVADMKHMLFRAVLWPLIARDYRLRNEGKRPDRWYWADRLALRLGMLEYYPY